MSGVSILAMVVLVSSVDKVLVGLVLEEEDVVVVVGHAARIYSKNNKNNFLKRFKKNI